MPVALRALLFTLVAPTTVGLLVPWLIAQHAMPADWGLWHHAGWLLVALGTLGYLLCVRDFVVRGQGTPNPLDPPRRFVATGLYRHVRNPMYVAVTATIAGQALLLGRWALLLYAALFWAVTATFVRAYEEPALAARYGAEYDAYRRAVPAWRPRLRPWRGDG